MDRHRIVFVIGYGGSQIPMLKKVVEEESREHGFEGHVISSKMAAMYRDLFSTADVVFLYTHELPGDIENAIKSNAKMIISASDSFLHLMRGIQTQLDRY